MYGLISRAGGTIPLKDIKVYATVNTFTAEVLLEQQYFNDTDSPLEVEYKFPLDSGGAIYHFEAVINGKTLVGKVEEKSKAQAIYSDAISAGKGAYLLSKESDDLFSMSVGNLPPQQSVILKVGYVAELSVTGESVLFDLIPNIFPQYRKDIYFEAQFKMAFPIVKITALPLNISVPFSIVNNNKCHGVIHPTTSGIRFSDEQLVLNIKLQEPHQPCVFTEVAPMLKSRAYALHFFPSTPYVECSAELVFLLDRSGSMSGTPIQTLQQTMYQVLKHLPRTSTFNIVGFGSNFFKLFPEALPCNPSSIRKARKHIATLAANLGGTNLLSPLQEIYQQKPRAVSKGDKPDRILFVLTDGEVDDTSSVVSLAKANKKTRLFTFGIGNQVSKTLIVDLAKAGQGTHTFIDKISEEEMEGKVISMLHKAVEPAHEHVEINWYSRSGLIAPTQIRQAPLKLAPIFNKQLYTVYGLVNEGAELDLDHVTLKATGCSGTQEFTIHCSKQTESSGLLLHRLAASTWIREIEEKSKDVAVLDKKNIIDLSVQYNVASTYASFVIVEDRNTPVMDTMSLVELNAPVPRVTGSAGSFNTAEVNDMFKDLSCLVLQQNYMIDTIESNIECSAQRVDSASFLLSAASTYQRKGRKKRLLIGLCVAILLMILVILLVVFLRK